MLSGRGLCGGLITRPEESYWVWCVSECNHETFITRRPWLTRGCRAIKNNVALMTVMRRIPVNLPFLNLRGFHLRHFSLLFYLRAFSTQLGSAVRDSYALHAGMPTNNTAGV
jgi:hypothetical protein